MSSKAAGAVRQLQVMEGLLSPFFGEAAPRLALAIRKEFGSLGKALSATEAEFANLGNDGRALGALLLAARHLIDGARQEKLVSTKLDIKDGEFRAFLRRRLCGTPIEKLIVIFCDACGHYLVDEEIGWGSQNSVELDLSVLFRKAIKVGASSFLMAHNHPSGICAPSDDDVRATRQVAHAAHFLGLSVIDHLIITTNECYSMRAGSVL